MAAKLEITKREVVKVVVEEEKVVNLTIPLETAQVLSFILNRIGGDPGSGNTPRGRMDSLNRDLRAMFAANGLDELPQFKLMIAGSCSQSIYFE